MFGGSKSKVHTNESQGEANHRLQSGIPRLDDILKGGFIKGSVYSVVGPPGSGKTIFGNQISYNFAEAQGGKSVIVSILVESVSKMIGHMQGLSFFRQEYVNDKVSYLSGYAMLKVEGYRGLLAMIRDAVRKHEAGLLILDGLESGDPGTVAMTEFKEFIHELQGLTALMECTTFILTPGHDCHNAPQNALVDGIMEFSRQVIGPRAVHEVTIHKFRGSAYLTGKHEVEITENGIQIHPRTEIQFADPPGNATEERLRMAFGVAKLDDMLEGGILSGSCTSLLGAPGTGKTNLGLHFLVEGAKQGQCGIYFGFYEPPPRLIEKADKLGLDLKHWIDEGLIEIIWQPPLEHFLDALAEQLLEKLRKSETQKRRRLFIDGIEGFRNANVYPVRMPQFLSAFTNQLRMLDITTLVSEELALFKSEVDMPNPELANVVEGVILLRYVEIKSQIHRLISIMKMRESKYDTSIREFRILDSGLDVSHSFESAEQVLSGHARTTSSPPSANSSKTEQE